MYKVIVILTMFVLINITTVYSKSNKFIYETFIENSGQWDKNVLFKAVCSNYNVWITNKGFVTEYLIEENDTLFNKYSEFILLNSNTPKSTNSIKLQSVSKFIRPNTYKLLNANNYSEITLSNIYSNIDIRYYFQDGNLRYDFILHPNADPKQINIEYNGINDIENFQNKLVIENDKDKILITDLKTYQNSIVIDSKFELKNKIISFNISEYNPNESLIIDPMVLVQTTKLTHGINNSNLEYIRDLKIDNNGDIYFIGNINSSDFDFNTNGTYKNFTPFSTDLIIGKCDKDFNIDWTMYFGGSGNDGTGVTYAGNNFYQISEKLDIDENYIYITGKTTSIGSTTDWSDKFPLTTNNLYTQEYESSGTSFFSVFSLNGDSLKYSTFLGNKYFDIKVFGSGIDVANSGNVYLIGNLNPKDNNSIVQELNPITTQNQTNSQYVSLIVGLSPTMTNNELDYNKIFISYFGGTRGNFVRDIDVDEYSEEIYITGRTKSTGTDFGVTSGAYDTYNTLDEYTNFVTKLHYDSTLSELIIDYNTFFGRNYQYNSQLGNIGSGLVSGSHSIVYKNGLIYFAGDNILDSIVNGVNIGGIPTRNAFDSTKSNSRYEGFLAVIRPNGNGDEDLIYSSYFGKDSTSKIFDLAYIDICDKISFVGYAKKELEGYNGILNNNYQNTSDIMVGMVDIYETGVNTLTDLAYIDSLETNYCYALQHSNQYNSIYAVGTSNSNTDMGLYNIEIDTCYRNCFCKDNNYGFIKPYVLNDGSCDSTLCSYEINFNTYPIFSPDIPEDPTCFRIAKAFYYLDNIKIDSIIKSIPSNYINLAFSDTICFEKGKNLRIEIKLYKDSLDLFPCVVTDSIMCEPDCRFDVENYLSYEYNEDGDFCITVSEIPDSLFPYSKLPKGFKFIDIDNNDTLNTDDIDSLDISFPIEFCIERCELMNLWANNKDSLLINLKFFGEDGEQITNLGCEDINLNIPLNFICNSFSTSITLIEDPECCIYNIDLIVDECMENDSIAFQIYTLLKNHLEFKSYVDNDFMTLNSQQNYTFDDINRKISFISTICDPSETQESYFELKLELLGKTCTKSIEYPVCKCHCPEDIDSWVTLTARAKEPPCSNTECHVSGEFSINIPSIYNCYTLFNVNDSTMHPITNSDGSIPTIHFSDCINQDTDKEYIFKFYKDENDTTPCEVVKSVQCPYEDFARPCTPDCDSVKWDIRYLNPPLTLPGCPGCKVRVKYASRRNTCFDPATQDIQILAMTQFTDGPDSLACQNCTLTSAEMYKEAMLKIIHTNEMEFDPVTPEDTCDNTWRIVNGACWAVKFYNTGEFQQTSWWSGLANIHIVWLPCDDIECCSMNLRVCRLDNSPNPDIITVDTLGIINGNDSCSTIEKIVWIKHLNDYDTLQCNEACLWISQFTTEGYHGKQSFNIEHEIEEIFKNETLSVKLTQYENLLDFELDSEYESNDVKISVHSLQGEIILENDYKLRKGNNHYHFHIDNLNSGFYFITIQIDGSIQKSEKIIIVR